MPSPMANRPAVLLATAMLLGCSSDDKRMNVCPRVAVLSEAGKITRFRPGPGRDILDIRLSGRYRRHRGLLRVSGCQTRCQARHRSGCAGVRVQPRRRQPDPQIDFTYFVSVVNDGDILSKQQFEAQTRLHRQRSRVIVQDDDPPITIDIPLPYKAAEYEYEVLVGFQLTADELAYNQRWQGLGR